LDQAKRDLARTTSTFEKGLSSQAQLDDAKTAWELAVIARDKAQQDLSYTTLTAPFDAQVSERIVENNSYVRAGETVAKVQDVSRFYFNINVPERLLSSYQKGSPVEASASIVSAPHKQYVLQYVEHATQPDPITQTYKVVFAADGRDSSLTPGARAVVKVTLGNKTVDTGVLVPFTALQGNDTEGFHVWRYNDADSTVNRVNINVLQIEGSYALVNGEIALGERVVAAGGAKMRDGLIVKPYMAE
jgi:RND family efflux transporter MFP subunit